MAAAREQNNSPLVAGGATSMLLVSSRTSATVQPGSRVTFDVPRDNALLLQERLGANEEFALALQAQLRVRGPDSARLVSSTHHFFQDMLQSLEKSTRAASSRRTSLSGSVQTNEDDDYHVSIARVFHQHLLSTLQKQQQTAKFTRAPSSLALLTDFSNAEGLLQNGVEAYIASVRKLLRVGVEDGLVEVALRGYSFAVQDKSLLKRHRSGNNSAVSDNVGQACFSLFCGLCLCIDRIVHDRHEHLQQQQQQQQQGGDAESLGGNRRRFPQQQHRNGVVSVLKDVTCLLKPGRLTLVLGPPGSGKTSLLKAISGQLIRQPGVTYTTGEVAYNGRSVSSLQNLPNWVAYASQSDEHMPLLSVRETLHHAFQCRKEIRYLDETHLENIREKLGNAAVERLEAFRTLDTDVVLAVLGLTRCADTIIGNETLKGVSGGERRRVTLGEMLAVGAEVLCLDEISTGLDSAATFDICQYLRHTAHIMEQCVVVALLQPPPETVNLFDDVLLIAEGQIIYHGETSKMMEYFEGLGFRRPPRKDVGDFLVELPTVSGAAFRMSEQELKGRGLARPPASAAEFAARWRQSEVFKSEDAQVLYSLSRRRANQVQQHASVDIDALPQNSAGKQLALAMSWMWRYRLKDFTKIRAKFAQNIVMGLLFGTLFFQIPKDEAYQKNILILNILMFTSQNAVPEIQANARARGIYHKHIDQGFYKAWMLALAQIVTMLPFVLLDVLIFGNFIYWLTGLAAQPLSYGLFMLVSTLLGATMQSIMGIFPYVIRDEMKATIAGVMVLIVSILMSGVIATAGVIPIYLKPIFDINPLAWAFRTLANIEFLSPTYDDNPCPVSLNNKHVNVPKRCGDFFLESREIDVGWKWVRWGVLVLSGYLVVFWCLSAIALTWVRFAPPRGKRAGSGEEEAQPPADSRTTATTSAATATDPLNRSSLVGGLISSNDQPLLLLHQRDSLSGNSSGSQRPLPSLSRQASLVPEPMTLVVHELGYTIKNPAGDKGTTDLLKGVSLFALPGRMLALMGSSGAGKTTLLDVMAGIKNVGRARGQIFLNGQPLRQDDFTRVAGYVQQFGVHSNTSTIRESLDFSMNLRLPSSANSMTSPADRAAFVQKTLDLLELTDIQDQLAGSCSMEQNKRLTLGVELVANPCIVFADEPTSGLDARAASIVMRVLQKVAKSGRVVIATIHQPSVQIFQRFDDLLLLKRGGEVVYFGELGQDSRSLIAYFEAIPGVPPCPDGANPAAWMLDIIGGGTGVRKNKAALAAHANRQRGLSQQHLPRVSDANGGDEDHESGILGSNDARDGEGDEEDSDSDDSDERIGVPGGGGDPADLDFAAVYRNSQLKRANDERIHSDFHIPESVLQLSATTERRIRPTNKFITPYSTQFRLLLKRNFTELWRSPDFSFLRFVVVGAFASMFVAIFYQQRMENMADVQSHILCITFSMSLASMFTMMTLIPFTINRRALFYRERGSGMYHAVVYTMAAGFSEVPYLFVTAALAVNIVYLGVGFNSHAFPYEYFFTATFLFLMMMAFVGMLMASVAPEPLSAQLAASAFFSIMNMFAGISVPRKHMPTPYLPIHYGSPLRWYYEGVLSTQFHGNTDIICNPLGKPVTQQGLLKLLRLCTTTGEADSKLISGVQVSVEDFVLRDFLEGFEYEHRFYDLLVLFGWILVLRVLANLATTYISFDRR